MKDLLQFQAERSNLGFLRTETALILSQLHEPIVLQRVGGETRDDAAEATDVDRKRCQTFLQTSGWMAAKRTTYMLHFAYTAPEQMVGLLDQRQSFSDQCLDRVVKTLSLITEAVAIRDDPNNGHQDKLALMEATGLLWFDRLVLVQLLWAKLWAHGFIKQPLLEFLSTLYSGILHTKYVLEDALQHANHLVRASRKKEIRMTRLAQQVASSPRLSECCNVPPVTVLPGDLASLGQFDIVGDDFRIRPVCKKEKSALIVEAIKALSDNPAAIKPSGTETDDKSIGALMSLHFTQGSGFQGISSLWPSALVQTLFIYRRKFDDQPFLALEHLGYTTVGWKLQTIVHMGSSFFKCPKLADDQAAVDNFDFLKAASLDGDIEGIPFKFSPKNDLPAALKHHGSLFEQTCPAESLEKHFIRNRSMVNITDLVLTTLMTYLKAPSRKLGTPRQSRLYSIVAHIRSDLDTAGHVQIVEDFLNSEIKKDEVLNSVPHNVARGALKNLSPEEQQFDYGALAHELDNKVLQAEVQSAKERHVEGRKLKEHETPTTIRALKPEHKGVWLVWDQGLHAFEGYYPAGKPTRSVSYSYKGPNARAQTTLHALQLTLSFLWDNHEAKGRDCTCRPSDVTTTEVLADALAEQRDFAKLDLHTKLAGTRGTMAHPQHPEDDSEDEIRFTGSYLL